MVLWWAGAKVDSIDYWAGMIRKLEADIVAARQRALEAPPCASFFVFFSSQKDAAIAAQTNLHPEDGNSFRVTEAPGPEEVLSTTGAFHANQNHVVSASSSLGCNLACCCTHHVQKWSQGRHDSFTLKANLEVLRMCKQLSCYGGIACMHKLALMQRVACRSIGQCCG